MNIFKTHILLLSILFLLFFSKPVSGLSVKTHEVINERVAQITLPNDGFSLNDYLINQLDLTKGIKEVFDKEEIKRWLELGGKYEDKPPRTIPYKRSINHFHDPITDMGYQGWFSRLGLGWFSGMSSIDWALKTQNTQDPGGYYSWNDVIGYYKEALTNEDQNIRNINFAKTFRGLGQLMHHIQDASSPAHTRNDQHFLYNYEAWVRDNIAKSIISGYGPIFFTGTKNGITSFIDTDRYYGTNPDITSGTDIGLSEYANANFFSNDTNAVDSEDYEYPGVNVDTNAVSIVEEMYINERVPPAENFMRKYYKKNCCGETNNGTGYLLTATEVLEYDIEDFFIDEEIPEEIKQQAALLDHNVYSDYAGLLLPRAIGYSAGFLEYFFRGKIEIIQIPDSDNIKIKNNSSEDMDGIFTLYYDAADGFRKQVSDGSWYLSPLQAGDTSNELIFTEPTDFAGDKQYILVFEGTLGSDYAVVGKVIDLFWEEPWGATVCDNNPWEAYTWIQGYEDYDYCPNLSNTIADSIGDVGATWSLNEGVLHHVVSGGADEFDWDAITILYAYPQNIQANRVKLKISTEVTQLDYYQYHSVIMMYVCSGNDDRCEPFVLGKNFAPVWDGYHDIGDNGGEEQIINLEQYGFIDEAITYVDIEVFCGWQVQCSYSLDYIDFYTE